MDWFSSIIFHNNKFHSYYHQFHQFSLFLIPYLNKHKKKIHLRIRGLIFKKYKLHHKILSRIFINTFFLFPFNRIRFILIFYSIYYIFNGFFGWSKPIYQSIYYNYIYYLFLYSGVNQVIFRTDGFHIIADFTNHRPNWYQNVLWKIDLGSLVIQSSKFCRKKQ